MSPTAQRRSTDPGSHTADPLGPLLPAPRNAHRRAGHFALKNETPIILEPGTSDGDFVSARSLRDQLLERCAVTLPIEIHSRSDDLSPCIALRHGGATGQAGDGYALRVRPGRIEIDAAGSAGLRYGVESLVQLATERARSPRLPACDIDDSPDYAHRGIMLDISRGKVPKLEALFALVDLCVRLKLNTLMLYTEHTFRFRRHPQIGAGSSPLDAQSLRALDEYAALRFVELVPTLQSLGHMEHILGLPAYASLAETEMGWTVSPAEPGTYALLGDLYDEYLPCFRSGLFNANCDEPWDLGRGKSAERERELGAGGVFHEHVRRISELARRHAKRTMVWGDVVHAHPERIDELDPGLIVLDWWYEADLDFDRVKVFADNGIEFWVCPGTSSWNSLFPRLDNSCLNTARWADAGRRHGAKGLVTTDWGDFGHYNLQGNSWFGYAVAAQQSWSGETPDKSFDRAFSRVLFGDESGQLARIYRALGAIHDPGFPIFNGSPLQYLYFDDIERSYFTSAATPAALKRCEAKLTRARDAIHRARPRLRRERLTGDELAYAADASLLAVRKSREGLEYNAWRREPGSWRAPQRRSLAGTLKSLAEEQVALGRRLRRLWLARSQPSNFEITKDRLDRSVRALRRAARRLENNRPSAAPPPHTGFTGPEILAALRGSQAGQAGTLLNV